MLQVVVADLVQLHPHPSAVERHAAIVEVFEPLLAFDGNRLSACGGPLQEREIASAKTKTAPIRFDVIIPAIPFACTAIESQTVIQIAGSQRLPECCHSARSAEYNAADSHASCRLRSDGGRPALLHRLSIQLHVFLRALGPRPILPHARRRSVAATRRAG